MQGIKVGVYTNTMKNIINTSGGLGYYNEHEPTEIAFGRCNKAPALYRKQENSKYHISRSKRVRKKHNSLEFYSVDLQRCQAHH